MNPFTGLPEFKEKRLTDSDKTTLLDDDKWLFDLSLKLNIHGGGTPAGPAFNLGDHTTDELPEGVTNLYSQWEVNTYGGYDYLQPIINTRGITIGQDVDSSVTSSFGGSTAFFNGNPSPTGVGTSFFTQLSYGAGYGAAFVLGHAGGTPAAPTQLSSGNAAGFITFTGMADNGTWQVLGASTVLSGFYGVTTADVTSGALELNMYIGSLLGSMIGYRTATNDIVFNERQLDSNITFYNDTGTTATMDGADGGMVLNSLNAANGLSIDSTNSTGTGLVVKAQTNWYTFEYQKSDGTNLLRALWDTGNFHHYLGGSLYYNLGGYNFVIDANANSNTGLVLTNGAELKLDASINGSVPNIRYGGGSYATAGVPLTTTNAYWNTVWGWNGSNGYTETSTTKLDHVMLSHTNGDSELRWLNNSAATVLKLGMLNSQLQIANGSASLPSLTTINSPTTGFYRKGADNLGLAAAASLIMDWSTSTQTYADAYNIAFGTTTGTKIGTATTQKLSFFNATPIARPAALTTQLTSITHTAPGTPDYAIQDLTNAGGYGFVTKDEGNTVLSVIANLQTRVAELETKLSSTAGLGLIA